MCMLQFIYLYSPTISAHATVSFRCVQFRFAHATDTFVHATDTFVHATVDLSGLYFYSSQVFDHATLLLVQHLTMLQFLFFLLPHSLTMLQCPRFILCPCYNLYLVPFVHASVNLKVANFPK